MDLPKSISRKIHIHKISYYDSFKSFSTTAQNTHSSNPLVGISYLLSILSQSTPACWCLCFLAPSRLSDCLPVTCHCVGSLSAWLRWPHWSASRPTVSTDSSRSRTLRRDWYSVSADLTTSWMRSSASTCCKCPKGLLSRSPFWAIGLYMMLPRSTYDSSHRSPTSHLDKDCGLQLPTSYVFLLLDCLLLDITPSLSPVLAYGTTYRLMSPQHHLCSSSEND